MKHLAHLALSAFAALGAASAQASLCGAGGTEAVVPGTGDVTHTFTNANAPATFTLSRSATVRLLVVGGGGGGGRDCAGGGGGGGVIAVDSVELPAGAYTITVGAGGAGGTSVNGSIGGATTIADANDTILYKALGGGGGVGWSGSTPVSTEDAPFASGGGGTHKKSGSDAGDATQGHDGATGTDTGPQGGGGAGGPAIGSNNAKSGNSSSGGPGVMSDITGTSEMYGAGGGGGAYGGKTVFQALPGAGGDGIGGCGVPENWHPTDAVMTRCAGRDGYGGGGGGGNNMVSNGARGGNGCVIIRLSNVDPSAAAPALDGAALEAATFFEATLSVTLASPGAGQASASVVLRVAEDAAGLADAAEISATAGADGLYRATAIGLRPAHAYVSRFVARNATQTSSSADVAFVTPALAERTLSVPTNSVYAGLWQYSSGGGSGLSFDFDETTEGLVAAPGAMMAAVRSPSQTNCPALHGASWTDGSGTPWQWNSNRRYGYVGWMWMEAGANYNFYEQIWDSVRLKIDNGVLCEDTTSYGATLATYSCHETGWHKIQVWFGGSGGNAGCFASWRMGLGWNRNGETIPWPDKDGVFPSLDVMSPLENDGSTAYLVREKPWRTVEVASAAPGASGIEFDISLGASDCGATELHCVWGDTYGGEVTNAWAHDELVGTVDAAATNETYTLTGATGSPLVRFYALHGDGTTAWSGTTKQTESESVAIADLGVDHDGDRATVSVRVDSVGTGDFSLRLLWGANADLSGASVTNVATSGTGTYNVTIPVPPGATTYYRIEASTTDGGSDATAINSFTTRAGSVLDAATSAAVANHSIAFTGSLATLGAGTTYVTLWMGESADALVADPEPLAVGSVAPFTFHRLVPGEEKEVYWKFTCANTGAGGASWSNETSVATAQTSENGIVYTWKAAVADGEWKDADNWTTATEGAFGYPAAVGAIAAFPSGSTNRIHLAGYAEARLRLQFTDGHITVYGDDPDSSYLYTGDTEEPATLDRSVFALENASLSEYDGFDYTIGGASTTTSRLVAANGASFYFGGGFEAVRGAGSGFTVCPGSAVHFHDDSVVATNKTGKVPPACTLLFAASGESLTIDDGLFAARELYVADPSNGGGQSFRIRGPGGLLHVTGGVFHDRVKDPSHAESKYGILSGDNPLTNALDVVFEPVGPYTNKVSYTVNDATVTEAVALVSTNEAGHALGGMVVTNGAIVSTGKIRLSVDTASMRGARSASQHFVLWRTGIDTSHVELVQGGKYTLSYTYGWPSTLAAPADAGDRPTGVWAEVPGRGGMILVVR